MGSTVILRIFIDGQTSWYMRMYVKSRFSLHPSLGQEVKKSSRRKAMVHAFSEHHSIHNYLCVCF